MNDKNAQPVTQIAEKDEEQIKEAYNICREQITRQSEFLDKSIITISFILINVLIAFVDNIINTKESIFDSLLWIGIAFLTMSVIITIISFYVSRESARKKLEYVIEYANTGNEDAWYRKTPYDTILNFLNTFSIILFAPGVILSLSFIIINGFKQSQTLLW